MGNKETKRFNVAVLGAAGGIGQPLSLLLATSPYVQRLHVYDVVPVVNGVGVDLSHINTPVQCKGFAGDLKDAEASAKTLREALAGSDVVVIPAGVPRKPGMTRADLFNVNAGIVAGLVEGIADACPKAMVCIISNPVNATVPIAAEVLKKKGCYDPKRLFGVSTLDVVRARKFIAEKAQIDPEDLDITVIGGHSGVTILPLLSQTSPKVELSDEEIEALTSRIQNAGTEVVEAKAGGGSATLSMAYAGYRFATSVMAALSGKSGIVECAYVPSDLTDLSFFASKVELGPEGAKSIVPFKDLSKFETEKLENEVKVELAKNIKQGVEFVANL
ncbi:Malate dehydrogenase, glyoxysomal [Hondaea fermentalgiana]|uniref:malate dehydrogenase n=1 Tax=Hondaea fermentalgiana TaxID=2315210 RepID=A0A2R5GM42_9STRA|nr:Malate dehydrogenase, glyoxysomal [Hondaea fermentalgiana]|eukprot:GBG29361.1 Malate dehydrogenase, glyoxysomal [Hondaea fermentalgiana]